MLKYYESVTNLIKLFSTDNVYFDDSLSTNIWSKYSPKLSAFVKSLALSDGHIYSSAFSRKSLC